MVATGDDCTCNNLTSRYCLKYIEFDFYKKGVRRVLVFMNELLSVHLQSFPSVKFAVNSEITDKMDKVRDVCNCVFSLRKDANIRVRMPLKKITICGNVDLEADYLDLIKQEVNTKEIEIFSGNIDDIASKEVVLNMKECGKIFGSKLKEILSAQKEGKWQISNSNGKLLIAGEEIEQELFSVVYKSKSGEKTMHCERFNLLVMIDCAQNEELVMEGLARDVIRVIQQTRKEKGLEINDRINAVLMTKDEIFNGVINKFGDYIKSQTLADNLEISADKTDANAETYEIDGYNFAISIIKV